MAKYKDTILAFLAYISDVEDEVKECSSVVKRVNSNMESSEILIELKTWKDVPEDYGNPQQIINKYYVEKCDIFIGVIWKKWGTPTGQSNCGFKEEFLIAEKRFDETGIPNIWLYTKDVDESLLKEEEKVDYQKVKQFKEEIILKHKGFVVSFKDTQDLKDKILNRFTTFLCERSVSKRNQEAISVSDKSIKTKSTPSEKIKSTFTREIRQLGKDIASYINNNRDLANLNDFKKIRLFLLSSSLFYNKHIYEVLGNHEIQLMYLHREKIKPMGIERRIILRTILDDPYNHKTGWFWLSSFKLKYLRNFTIGYLLRYDGNENVRLGALRFLEKFWLKRYFKLVLQSLKDNSKKVLLKALEILEQQANESCITTIDPFISNPDVEVGKAAWRAEFAIYTRTNVKKAIPFLLDFSDLRNNYTKYLKDINDRISVEELKSMTKDKDRKIQEIGYLGLINREQLNDAEIVALTTSDISAIQKLSFLKQIEKGRKLDPAEIRSKWHEKSAVSLLLGGSKDDLDEVVLQAYSKNNNKDEVLSDIDWLSGDGPLAYYALYHFFEEPIEEVRGDLENNFNRIEKAYYEKTGREVGVDNTLNVLRGYIIGQYAITALKILNEKGNKQDIVFARRFISSTDSGIQRIIMDMMTKWGDETDISNILKFSSESYGELKEKSGRLAIQLDQNGKQNVAEKYLDSNDEILINISLQSDLKQKLNRFREKAKSLLLNDNSNIRLSALSYLIRISSNKDLDNLLKTYLTNSSYYYDVVCWLDRILFSPTKFRVSYKKDLVNKLL